MTLDGDDQNVADVAFSPDGELLATAAGDRTIRLFDASTGDLEFALAGGQRFPVGRIAFSSDGTKLASQGPMQGVVRVWALDVGDLLDVAEENVTRSITADECDQYPYLDACIG